MESPVYRQTGSIGAKAIAGLKTLVLLSIACLAVEGWYLLVVDESYLTDELHLVEFFELGIGFAMLAVLLFTVVCFCRWMHRSYANLKALGAPDPRYTPGWAVGSFFIPVVNLFLPYRAMKDIWNGSVGRTLTDAEPLLAYWWAAWIVAGVLDSFHGTMAAHAETVLDLRAAATLEMVTEFLMLVAAYFAVRVVEGATERQHNSAVALGLASPQAAGFSID